MYYLQDRVTGQPVDMGNMGRVRRVYGLRLLAQRDAQAVKEKKGCWSESSRRSGALSFCASLARESEEDQLGYRFLSLVGSFEVLVV